MACSDVGPAAFVHVWPKEEVIPPTAFFVAVHGFDDSLELLDFISQRGEVLGIMIKQHTNHHTEPVRKLRERYHELDARSERSSFPFALDNDPLQRPCVIIDHGGCFAAALTQGFNHPVSQKAMKHRIMAIVEISSSGVAAYKKLQNACGGTFPVPVVTVVDSPEKQTQNKVVAHDVWERCTGLMQRDDLPLPQTIGVLGCGRVGGPLVDRILATGLAVCAYDTDPATQSYLTAMATAPCRPTPITLALRPEEILEKSLMLLVATGQDCKLRTQDARHMQAGTVVANITSNDTTFPHFFTEVLKAANAASKTIEEKTATLTVPGPHGPIHILTLGNAVNLSCGSSLDPDATLKLHAQVIDVTKRITRNMLHGDDLPQHEILSSAKIAELMPQEAGGRRTNAFNWSRFWPVEAEILPSEQTGDSNVYQASSLWPPTRGTIFLQDLELSEFDTQFYEVVEAPSPIEATGSPFNWTVDCGQWAPGVIAKPVRQQNPNCFTMAY